jgi:hypothetical protein
MGLHLCYQLAADESADPGALLEQVRTFAATLPFDRVSDLVTGPQLLQPGYGSDWDLPLDANGQIRPKGWEPDDESWHGDVTVAATEWTGFRIDPGLACETAYLGLARHPSTWPVEGELQPTGLDRSWRWDYCCKTQVAAAVSTEHFMRCHGSLVSLLDFGAGLGLVAEVTDETGFWEHRDWAVALSAVAGMYGVVAEVVASLCELPGSEAWQQAVADLRRKLPPEPSPEG